MKAAYQIIVLQLTLAALAAGGWFLAYNWPGVIAAVAAGIAAIVPNFLFAKQLFSDKREPGMAKQVLKRFYRGVALKIVVTAVLFWFSIVYLQAAFLPFVTTYLLCQVATWLSPILMKKSRTVSA